VVSQIRLQPQVVQNVVTYSVVIDAPNRDLVLKPGMTANVTIEVARRDAALRVPAASLRFTPAGQSSQSPQVWRSDNGALTPVPVKTGLSDGQFTEVVEGNLSVGDSLAVRQSTPNESVRPAAASPFQFMQPQGRGTPSGRRGG
jgi:HlyD family secretion protein